MIQTTKWKPDTCGCEVEYTWDDTLPQELRTHNLKNIRPCAGHQAHPAATAYREVLDENQSKNLSIALLVKQNPKLKDREHEVKWRFKEDRSLVISHESLTKKELDDMKDVPKDGIVKGVSFE